MERCYAWWTSVSGIHSTAVWDAFVVFMNQGKGVAFQCPVVTIRPPKAMLSNIKLSLNKLNPLAVLALLRNVVAEMTGNLNFVTPAVPLATLASAGDALETAIQEATNGSRQSRLVRGEALEVVKDLLRKQADYVRTESDGVRQKLASSGFALRKEKEPIEMVDAPKGEVATSTKSSGVIELRFRRVRGAHFYKIYHLSLIHISEPTRPY